MQRLLKFWAAHEVEAPLGSNHQVPTQVDHQVHQVHQVQGVAHAVPSHQVLVDLWVQALWVRALWVRRRSQQGALGAAVAALAALAARDVWGVQFVGPRASPRRLCRGCDTPWLWPW